ncbi:hypothetical protein F2Q68_00004223 [Brassica cretica]|uniref:Uncharacterized protein n=1 Tax=Brassica cretica TaxID=69181 RepID=A0A8S9J5K5_BRACR|nr:hypothetical protein F2Q68_00004223 [Brassica cretica]
MQVFQIWKTFGTTYLEVVWTSWKSSEPRGSRLDLLEVVFRSGRLLGRLTWKSSGPPGSRLDLLEVVWTSSKSSGKPSGPPGSRLTESFPMSLLFITEIVKE